MCITIISLFLFTSLSNAIACTDYGSRVTNFLNTLSMANRYTGPQTDIVSSLGEGPEIVRSNRGYSFERRSTYSYKLYYSRCSPDDGQCEYLSEENWRYNPINHCLYIGLNNVRITERLTQS